MAITDFQIHKIFADYVSGFAPVANGERVSDDAVYNQTLQIDWVTFKVPFFYSGRLNGGRLFSVDADGSLDYEIDKRRVVRGSYESNLTIRTADVTPDGNTWLVEVSGNPVKWFQGHNLFGTADLPNLIYETVLRLADLVNSPQPECFTSWVKQGFWTVSRVDITAMYLLPTRSDVLAWLKHAEKTSRSRAGTAISKGNTVYLNKDSERWNVVMYSKGQELEKHPLPKDLESKSLSDFADNKLRIELRLRGKELAKIEYKAGTSWLNLDVAHLFNDYVGRIEMTEQSIRDERLFDIPKSARTSYQLWSCGCDVRQYVSRAKFYKDRKALLEFGVDISVAKPVETNVNVVPLRRVLELKPAGVPEWAYGTNLYFEPRKVC